MTRPETGSMEFEGDWCGCFIRGDSAHYFAFVLRNLLNNLTEQQKEDVMMIASLEGLCVTLSSCEQQIKDPDRQYMKKFEECIKNEKTIP